MTSCLQAAADAAASAGKPLLIPATAAYYKISAPIVLRGSVIGTGGMPTIRTTTSGAEWSEQGAIFQVEGSNLWIFNLHLVGTFNGSGTPQDMGPNITLGNVSNITIKGNLLENPQGDSINDHHQVLSSGSGGPRNVLVDSNTMKNPGRCIISLVELADSWAIVNNVTSKSYTTDSSFDWEPWHSASYITNIELAYNNVTQWSGDTNPVNNINGWFDTTPGANIFTHHNYGSWASGSFATVTPYQSGGVYWSNTVNANNAQGASVP